MGANIDGVYDAGEGGPSSAKRPRSCLPVFDGRGNAGEGRCLWPRRRLHL